MLKDKIHNEMITTLKERGDQVRLNALRLVLSEITTEEKKTNGGTLSDQQVLEVLNRYVKKRQAAADEYRKVGAADKAAQELFESVIIEKYLPAKLTDDEVKNLVTETIATVGAQSVKDLGKVMGAIKSRTDVDKKVASGFAKQLLS